MCNASTTVIHGRVEVKTYQRPYTYIHRIQTYVRILLIGLHVPLAMDHAMLLTLVRLAQYLVINVIREEFIQPNTTFNIQL